ncbi:MAG: carboxymuconolactone decarboxylase family protein [Planctomycetes bacterium]|nr:carboxymuconolactone decarboxylase family protein [Planctomycetota bacterium]
MAHIRLVEPHEATGSLKAQYDAAIGRAGRVWNIVKTMSPNPPLLDASMRHYGVAMHGASPLTRVQRELLAVVVSRVNGCFY